MTERDQPSVCTRRGIKPSQYQTLTTGASLWGAEAASAVGGFPRWEGGA